MKEAGRVVVSELEGPSRPEGFDGLSGRIDAKGTATATATSGSILDIWGCIIPGPALVSYRRKWELDELGWLGLFGDPGDQTCEREQARRRDGRRSQRTSLRDGRTYRRWPYRFIELRQWRRETSQKGQKVPKDPSKRGQKQFPGERAVIKGQ